MLIPRNYVLIECKPLNDRVEIAGKELIIDTSYEPTDYVATTGTVVALPEKLYFNPKDPNESMEWECDCELKVGDKVYMDYHSVIVAFGHRVDRMQDKPDPRWMVYEGKECAFIHYQDIFCYERDGELKTINGYSIVEQIEKPNLGTVQLLENMFDDYVKVAISGQPNKRYVNPEYVDAEVSVGDLVFLKKAKSKYQSRVSIFLRSVHIGGKKRMLTQGRWLYARYERD